MNIDEIAKLYGTEIETYQDGEWVTEAPKAASVDEIAAATTTVATATEFDDIIADLKVTPAGPAKIIGSLRRFGFSVKRIADLIGVAPSTVYAWQRMANWPLDENYEALLRLARSI